MNEISLYWVLGTAVLALIVGALIGAFVVWKMCWAAKPLDAGQRQDLKDYRAIPQKVRSLLETLSKDHITALDRFSALDPNVREQLAKLNNIAFGLRVAEKNHTRTHVVNEFVRRGAVVTEGEVADIIIHTDGCYVEAWRRYPGGLRRLMEDTSFNYGRGFDVPRAVNTILYLAKEDEASRRLVAAAAQSAPRTGVKV